MGGGRFSEQIALPKLLKVSVPTCMLGQGVAQFLAAQDPVGAGFLFLAGHSENPPG